MIFKFSKEEVVKILENHVRSTYDIQSNQPIDIKLSVKKSFFFGLNFDSAAVEVKEIKK